MEIWIERWIEAWIDIYGEGYGEGGGGGQSLSLCWLILLLLCINSSSRPCFLFSLFSYPVDEPLGGKVVHAQGHLLAPLKHLRIKGRGGGGERGGERWTLLKKNKVRSIRLIVVEHSQLTFVRERGFVFCFCSYLRPSNSFPFAQHLVYDSEMRKNNWDQRRLLQTGAKQCKKNNDAQKAFFEF